MSLVVVAGCAGGSARGPAPDRSPVNAAYDGPPIVVTARAREVPAPCRAAVTARRVVAFLGAFNRGDRRALSQQLARPGRFAWYRSGLWLPKADRDPQALSRQQIDDPEALSPQRVLDYMAKRHAAGERLRLVELQVTYIPAGTWIPRVPEMAGIVYIIERTARDLPRRLNRYAQGKGGLTCADGKVVVWSMGLDARRARIPLGFVCSRRPRLRSRTILACERNSGLNS